MKERLDLGPSVPELLPARPTLPRLRLAARDCRACHLFREATQTVFGEGPASAEVMFVGEQPGDAEDRAENHSSVPPADCWRNPWKKPASTVATSTSPTSSSTSSSCVVAKRRIHRKPNAEEIRACFPWLEAEIAAVRPRIVVCLGAVAAQALLGSRIRVTKDRGKLIPADFAEHAMVTVHPSSILRAPDDESRRSERRAFVRDMKVLAKALVPAASGASRRAHG